LENSSPVCIFIGLGSASGVLTRFIFFFVFLPPGDGFGFVAGLCRGGESSFGSCAKDSCLPPKRICRFVFPVKAVPFLTVSAPGAHGSYDFHFSATLLAGRAPQFFCSSHSHKEWQDSLHMQHEIKFLFGV
jgi:hypothetical protein